MTGDRRIADFTLHALLDAHAPFRPAPLVPELAAWQADDEVPLWTGLEAAAGARLPPPFFCTAWPGAIAVARALLDGAVDVQGRVIADIGCGSGLVACAALKAGAARAIAVDLDPLAVAAAEELGRRHGVRIEGVVGDGLADDAIDASRARVCGHAVDVILAGDLVSHAEHEAPFRRAVSRWRRTATACVIADGGRPFFDATDLTLVVERDVPASPGVEGVGSRRVRVFRVSAP